MSVPASMIRKLSDIGVYEMTGDALTEELTVYARELDRVENLLDSVLNEAFFATAMEEGLEGFERIFGPVRSSLSLAQRRGMLCKRLLLGSDSFTPSKMATALDSLNLSYTLSEYPTAFRLNIIADTDYTAGEQALILREIEQMCPAHLEVQVCFNTLPWSELDAKGLTFDEIDALDMTWTAFDQIDS